LKCLAKNSSQRYASARELAEDLERFLRGQPIRARPPSLCYRSGKFIKRNKMLAGAGLTVMAVLTAGIITTSIAAVREAHQRDLAEISAQHAESARKDALLDAYQARLATALAALGDHNVGEAADQLNAVPEAQRGWEWHYAAGRLDDSAFAFDCFSSLLTPCMGGARIAAVTRKGIHLWDAHTGQTLADFACATPTNIVGLDGGPGSSLLVSYKEGPTILLSETGQVQQRFVMPSASRTHALAWDRAGRRLALAGARHDSARNDLSLFELSTGQLMKRCADAKGEMRSLAFSPDGRLVAGGGDNRSVQIWDTDSGKSVRVLRGHSGYVYTVVFSPDGRRILTG
jgi:hypothetical protein